MAIIKVTNTGSGFSGSAGDIYYKMVNGKQVFCSKPTHYTLPSDKVSVKNRKNMGLISHLASSITKTPYFRTIWKNSDIKGVGPFHKFVSFNHPKKEAAQFSNIRLTSTSEFSADISSPGFQGKNLKLVIQLNDVTAAIDPVREPFISVGGFLIDENDTGKKKPFGVIYLENKTVPVDITNPITVNLPVVELPDAGYKLLLLVSTLNSTEQPVRHSETVYL